MRLAATKTIGPGTKVAKTVYNEKGQILIQKDVELTERMLQRLLYYKITYIYIHDAVTDGIEIESPISEELKIEAYQTIKQSFSNFQNKGSMASKAFIRDKTGEQMTGLVQSILNQLQGRKEVISILSDVIISDDYIFTHSLNVTIYSLALGKELGLPVSRLEEIGLGAMLHDVGKMFIPEEILNKKGKLKDEEFEILKQHTGSGFEFLRKSPNIPLLAAHCAFQHHERLNGTGYPRGIKESEIHPYAKIIAVADVFDAVTSNRVYRDAMLPHEGLEILYAGVGNLFDQKMVEAFRKTIAVYPNGLSVDLSDGRKGIVAAQNENICERPVIRILSENGITLSSPYDLDLAEHLNVLITSCETEFASRVSS